jgi:hypothetical protein
MSVLQNAAEIDVRRELQKLLLKFTHILENQSLQQGDEACSIIRILEQTFAANGKKAENLCNVHRLTDTLFAKSMSISVERRT